MGQRGPIPTLLPLLPLLSLLSLSPSFTLAITPVHPAYHQKLGTWANQLDQVRKLHREEIPISLPVSDLKPMLELTSPSEWRDVILQAASAVTEGDVSGRLTAMTEQNVTSELCVNHTLAMLTGIMAGDQWAMQMLDAMGKPLPGITVGDVNWPGEYNQCLRVRANTTVISHPDFSGRYCSLYSQPPAPLMAFPMTPTIVLGLCVPDTCSATDLTLLVTAVVQALNVTTFHPLVMCPEKREINTKAVVAIVICSIILALMVMGTAVDVLLIQWPKWTAQKYQEGLKNGDLLDGEAVQEGGGEEGDGGPQGVGEAHHHHHHHHHHPHASTNPEYQTLLPKSTVKTSPSPPEIGVLGTVLVSFSVYTNASKLLTTDQSPGSLTCVHGIRFLSMSWVVLGHTWGSPAAFAMNLVPYLNDLNTHWPYQAITNATVSVDSFFVLSGLLVAYLTLKEMKKRGGKLNWFLFYFHRFWRLTPAYMLCLMVYVCLSPYWGDGPMWPAKLADEDFCADNWWTNLLYVNNLVNTKESCFGHSWYLANDMQFYILSPLIFVPLFFFPVVGVAVSVFFLLLTSIIPGVLSQHYGLPPGLLQQVEGSNPNGTSFLDYFEIYYLKPYNRMGPYVIGMLAGYFLYRSNCKLRIHWLTSLAIWAVATACALAVLYGLYESSNGHPVTVPVAAFYNAVNRQVWGACVAWVVVACVTGNGGFVNSILSWRALVPLSRLTYCTYLLHLMVLQLFTSNARNPFYLDDLNLVFLYCGVLVAATAVAFVASLAFEAPMMGLERAFLRPYASKPDSKRG